MSDLPEAMVTEILIRLPVISMLVGKCVCKAWLSIISNPNFINSQLHRFIKNPPLLITLIRPGHEPQLPQDNIFFKIIVTPAVFETIRPLISRLFCGVLFVSCFNGIICVRSLDDVVHLRNPSIRKFKKLPPPPGRSLTKLGFGYDSISKDYKVVRITEVTSRDRVSLVQVYSTNADSWTEFPAPILKKVDVYDAKTGGVNGVLYFSNRVELISFDLHVQVVGTVPVPDFFRGKRSSEIMDFQGSLAMLFESGPGIFELWTLEGLPAHKSWTNKFNFRSKKRYTRLYSYLGGGQFWGVSYTTHFVLDYESEEIYYFGPIEPSYCAFIRYSETLVSLNGFEPVESVAN